MDTHLAANRAVLDEIYDHLTAMLRETGDDAIEWTPPIAGANSIAALTRHIAGSNDAWLRRALGDPVQRDRESEFRYRGTAPELIELLTASRATVHELFTRLATIDPATVRHYRRLGDNHESALTVAWCVEHALVHTSEHWGQIQLTRQFYDRQS